MEARPGLALQMVIAVYCHGGTHRSVAIAECLRHIGETVEGLMFFASSETLGETAMGEEDVQRNVLGMQK